MNNKKSKPTLEICKTCTQFLKDELPFEICYTSCLGYDVIGVINKTFNVNPSITEVCPNCGARALIWNKDKLAYECLHCSKGYNIGALEKARKLNELKVQDEKKRINKDIYNTWD
jgi:hypothetical protein